MMNDTNWLNREEYPFSSHSFRLPIGNMHYLDEGSGEPVVMVHGNPTWSFLYRKLIKKLSGRFRCIAMDHIGFGLSDKPTNWSYRPEEHAHHLSRLIEKLKLSDITLVVQDWGGPLGLSYAINNPEKIKRIVIMNTWMWPVNNDWYYIIFSRFTGGLIGRFLIKHNNFFVRVIMPQSFANHSNLTEDIHQHYIKPLQKPDQRKGCWTLPAEIINSTTWLRNIWEKRNVLMDLPKLIVWGMKDIAFREKELKIWLDSFPSSEVVRLYNVGHYVQEEGAEELGNAVNRFLSSSTL